MYAKESPRLGLGLSAHEIKCLPPVLPIIFAINLTLASDSFPLKKILLISMVS